MMTFFMANYSHFPVVAIMTYFLVAFLIVIFGNIKPLRNILAIIGVTVPLLLIGSLFYPVIHLGETIVYWLGNRSLEGGYAFGIALEVDALSLFFGILVTVAVFVSGIYSIKYMENDDHIPQYYTLLMMLSGGVLGLVLTGDLFNMFIMVEILTFAAVALTAFRNQVNGALEAAFKYLVVGCMGSSCILIGIIILYAETHTLNLAQLSALLPGNFTNATKLAFAFLTVGFATKSFIIPFHPLAADAHGAAPASISVLISGVLTKSGIYGLIRLNFFVFQVIQLESIQTLFLVLGCVSMFVCVTMALAQHDFKRLLAYHSISQIGYVITGIGLCTAMGFSSGLFHAMNHTLFKGLLFLSAGAVLHKTGTTNLDELGGLSKKMPHTTVLFLIGAASISGLPPFNGFASKWMIYQAAFDKAGETGNLWYAVVAIVCLITSVLTLASFIKVTHSVFYGRLNPKFENVTEVSHGMRFAMGIFAFLCILTGIAPGLVTNYLTLPAATAAFNPAGYIDAAMGEGYALSNLAINTNQVAVTTVEIGCYQPLSWLLLLCVALLAVTLVAVMGKYDNASAVVDGVADSKHELFWGGEKSEYTQVTGSDMFWGFKYNFRHYFSFMHNLHSGVLNDYALWAVIALALCELFMLLAL